MQYDKFINLRIEYKALLIFTLFMYVVKIDEVCDYLNININLYI